MSTIAHDVCTYCRATTDCTVTAYAGRGAYTFSRSTQRTWHAIAQPSGVDNLEGVPCEPPSDLGRDYAVVPVTHTRAGTAGAKGSLWLYYARGCSDLGWGVGRTLLARNREDLAVRLMQRLHGAMGRGDATLRVAALAAQHFQSWAAKVVRAANRSQHAPARTYWARARGRNAISLPSLLADAARGIVQRTGGDEGCHLSPLGGGAVASSSNATGRATGTAGAVRVCAGACATRARALLHVFGAIGGEGHVMDALNAELLSKLCDTRRAALDSVVLHQQPTGASGRWATEIWDATRLCVLRGVGVPTGPNGEPVGGPLWLNGSRCARSRPDEYRRCYACDGSRLQRACATRDWRKARAHDGGR